MARNKSNRGLASADEETRQRVAHQGGEARKNQGADYSELGHLGGEAAQDSGNAHELTQEERSRGGSNSGGNFKNDRERASRAGQKGGSRKSNHCTYLLLGKLNRLLSGRFLY